MGGPGIGILAVLSPPVYGGAGHPSPFEGTMCQALIAARVAQFGTFSRNDGRSSKMG